MLIGLMGSKGSGKDTVADHLVSKYANWTKRSMAEPLKRACQELFLFTDEQLYGTQAQKEQSDSKWFGCSPRKCLQYVGTDLLRDQMGKIMPGLNQDIFIHHFKLWHEQHLSYHVVVPDIRFENEVEMIHQLGGVVIKINRPSLTKTDNHASEVAMESVEAYDWEVVRNCMRRLMGLLERL
jgi:hypothetical protein